jgi:hypothetical protein
LAKKIIQSSKTKSKTMATIVGSKTLEEHGKKVGEQIHHLHEKLQEMTDEQTQKN